MSDLTEHMAERMRVEIAQSAADDLMNAINRLPDCPERQQALRHIDEARSLVAETTTIRKKAETFGWIVHVQTVRTMIHVVVRGPCDSLAARDRALDALLDRGRITSAANVVTETKHLGPGQVLAFGDDDSVIYL